MIENVRRGVGWGVISRIVTQLGQLIVTIVMSRYLLPEDYGKVAMITIFIGFSTILVEMGLGSSVVYKNELSHYQLSTVFWIQVLLSLFCGGVFFCLSSLISSFYQLDNLQSLIRVFSITFLFGAIGVVSKNLLLKKFSFKEIAVGEIISNLLAGGIGLFMATRGWGVWSLVYYQLALKFLQAGIFFIQAKWVPSFYLKIDQVRELLKYGRGLAGFNIVNYWARQGDSLLIGKLLGSDSLGLYNRAYSLMLLPVSQITSVVGQVMFPALSSINQDAGRVKAIYLRMQAMIVFVSFPMMLGLFAVADEFVLVLFGIQWKGMVPVFRILCIVSLFQVIGNPTGLLFSSLGHTDKQFQFGLINSAIILLFIGGGVLFGTIEWVACGYLLANIIITPIIVYAAGRSIQLGLKDIVRTVLGSFLCSAVMCLFVFVFIQIISTYISSIYALLTSIIVGIIVYVVLVFLFRLKPYLELMELLRARRIM